MSLPVARSSFLTRACYAIAWILFIYFIILAAFIMSPWLQSHVVFLHWVRYPFARTLSNPAIHFGFRFDTARNFYIPVKSSHSETIRIGAWHLTSSSVRQNGSSTVTNEDFDRSLASCSHVYFYLHGNAGNRGTSHRVHLYKLLLALGRPKAHLVAIDYRGYGDSVEEPSEEGLIQDALAGYEWLLKRVPARKIIALAHSLGTGVTFAFAKRLGKDKTMAGIVTLAAYTSIPETALTFYSIPLAVPLGFLFRESAHQLMFDSMRVHFNSSDAILALDHIPILFLHGHLDYDIPVQHSRVLYLQALQIPSNLRTISTDLLHSFRDSNHGLVEKDDTSIHFFKSISKQGKLRWLVELEQSGHNNLPQFDSALSFLENFVFNVIK